MKSLTSKEQALVNLVKQRGEVQGCYELAEALKRPYSRTWEHVKDLAKRGHLQLHQGQRAGRRVNIISSIQPKPPVLSVPYVWSNPNAPRSTIIAAALTHPRLDDVIALCRYDGIETVKQIHREMIADGEIPESSRLNQRLNQLLKNIEYGARHADQQSHACAI